MTWALEPQWYYRYALAREAERGLDAVEDHLCVAKGAIELASGESCTIELRSADARGIEADPWERFAAREADLGATFRRTSEAARSAPAWIERLAVCADQFVVGRDAGTTVIAGYPWFTDWGRDTMVALPGLCLTTGRARDAAQIVATFARHVDRGMIPNRFLDAGGAPEYNTADATLWYALAVHGCWKAGRDEALELLPVMAEIVDWHVRGTRYGIERDPADGLLATHAPGTQLTWMDARVGERAVTPRVGKPVELSALWANALGAIAEMAAHAGKDASRFVRLRDDARAGFARFWNGATGYLYDVLDGPAGHDPTLRPNQLFAISLPEALLTQAQARAVVAACARSLLTSYGLRSLAPSEPGYVGRCEGDPATRDGAYHQGTAWGWLLGPFALAHYRAYDDAAAAMRYLEPLEDALFGYGVGTLGEIFDGDPPHTPRGCTAQAWSVAETLRAWTVLEEARGRS